MSMIVSEINQLFVLPAREYWLKQDWDSALAKLDQGLVSSSFDGLVTLTRGYVLLKKQKWAESDRMFAIALKKLPMPEYKNKARRALFLAKNPGDIAMMAEVEKDMVYVWNIFMAEPVWRMQVREQRELRIGLITCTRNKAMKACRARDLYGVSPDFSSLVEFAEQHYAKTFVVSARHGLVGLDQWLEPYDRALSEFTEEERSSWATFIVANLKAEGADSSQTVYIHADDLYRTHLENALFSSGICSRWLDYREVPSVEWLKETEGGEKCYPR